MRTALWNKKKVHTARECIQLHDVRHGHACTHVGKSATARPAFGRPRVPSRAAPPRHGNRAADKKQTDRHTHTHCSFIGIDAYLSNFLLTEGTVVVARHAMTRTVVPLARQDIQAI